MMAYQDINVTIQPTKQDMGIWVFGYLLIPMLIPKVSKKVFQVFRVNLFTLGKNVFLKIFSSV